jgi:hypothetical protein
MGAYRKMCAAQSFAHLLAVTKYHGLMVRPKLGWVLHKVMAALQLSASSNAQHQRYFLQILFQMAFVRSPRDLGKQSFTASMKAQPFAFERGHSETNGTTYGPLATANNEMIFIGFSSA